MAITNGYITLEELQQHLHVDGFPAEFTQSEKDMMETAVNAVCRLIDQHTGTRFYTASETRYYTASQWDLLWVDDLISVTTLKTDENGDGTYENTWSSSTDYFLEPRNAQVSATASERTPYRQIRVNVANGNYTFPLGVAYGVELAGSFGFCPAGSEPDYIKQAALLMANRTYRRKDAIFGIAGTPQLGVTIVQARIQQDSDIMQFLEAVPTRGFYA